MTLPSQHSSRGVDMRNLGVWASGSLLVLAFLSGCARSPQARRDKYLADGKALLEKKDYTRAILNFRNAVQAMPNDAEAYYQIGLAALHLGDLRTGALSLKKAVEFRNGLLGPIRSGVDLPSGI